MNKEQGWITEDRMWEVGDPPTTRVDKRCRHPERWDAYGPQTTTRQEVMGLVGLIHTLQPDNVLELGTHAGYAALNMAHALKNIGHGHLWTVEMDQKGIDMAKENLAPVQDCVTLVHADAKEWTPPPRTRFQFGFVDITDKGSYHELYAHYHHYFDVGAIVAFHDTGSFWGGRMRLRPLQEAGLLRLIHLPTPRGLSLGEVLN